MKKTGEYLREQDKKRSEYIRERDKKQREHYRQMDKRAHEDYNENRKRQHEYAKERRKHKLPAWAPYHRYDASRHIYFRDYGTFHDPYRCGYVYRKRGKWVFSVTVPTVLVSVDLGRTRVRAVENMPVQRHPEDFYDQFGHDYWD